MSETLNGTGIVDWFDHRKGFGIIKDVDTNNEVFVHHSVICGSNRKRALLLQNQKVLMKYSYSKNKYRADEVIIINDNNDDNNGTKGSNDEKKKNSQNEENDESKGYDNYSTIKNNNGKKPTSRTKSKTNHDEQHARISETRKKIQQRNQQRNYIRKKKTGSDRNNNNNNNNKNNKNNKKRKKNTETFAPDHSPPDIRIVIGNNNVAKYNERITAKDVVFIPNFFEDTEEINFYNSLLKEMKETTIDPNDLWKLWHGDNHLIADDSLTWKDACPTFNLVIEKIENYFNMKIEATRFNWYKDSSQFKPYHHDAAAIKPHIAKIQNFTVGISFGSTRDASFQHAQTKTRIDMPLPNGSCYCFAKDVNVEWRHGIPQVLPEFQHNDGRISIIAWGKVEMG